MKTELQVRAEQILDRFKAESRKPIIIEFAGVPKAGKTSTLTSILTFFKRCRFKVRLIVECASVCPINDKRNFTFNVWTAANTLAQILEHTQGPPPNDDPIDILFVDRGLFDAIFLLTMMEKLNRMTTADRSKIEQFLTIDEWRKRITGVIVMTVSPAKAMAREQGFLPVEGAKSSIMTGPVLRQMKKTVEECLITYKDKFKIFHFDTTSNKPKSTVEAITKQILDLIEEELEEDILYLPARSVQNIFKDQVTIRGDKANSLLAAFSGGKYRSRKFVESNKKLIQAIPVVVIRDKSGRVLCLRRREKEANKLHEKLVIWAGGHVRKEDGSIGSAILQCAVRELKEELRLSVDSNELKFLGAIHSKCSEKTGQHTALVYEWRANTDDISIILSTVEFFERRGTSVSGKFFDVWDLPKELTDPVNGEIWSSEIIRYLLNSNDN